MEPHPFLPAGAPAVRIRGALGAGATARVLRGTTVEPWEDLPAGTEVAVKIQRPELAGDPRAARAFEAEAAAGSSARHPALVRALWAGRGPEGACLVMRFVPGRTLREVLAEEGPLPEPLLRSLSAQVAGALAALHSAGFAHGDVKPENLRLDGEGRAVLIDLGFARRLDAGEGEDGAAGGSPAVPASAGSLTHLAPERARGGPATRASDVFALGVTLYELATGRHPFSLEGAAREAAIGAGSPAGAATPSEEGGTALLAAILAGRWIPPSGIVPQLSPFLDHLLAEMLAEDPAARPAAEEVEQRFAHQERGPWWRSRLEYGAAMRRGVMGDPSAAHLTPLVGREAEMAALVELFERSREGGRLAVLRGPVGSGKSRLSSDFAALVRAGEDPPLYLYARCSGIEEQRPCAPVLRLLERYLRLPPGGEPGERERRELARLVPPRAAETLFQALSPDFEGATQTAVPVALARLFAALGHRGPLILFVDDADFADEGTLYVLSLLAGELSQLRALLVLGLREAPEPGGPLARIAARAGAAEIELAPLSEKAVAELVDRLFHPSSPRLRIASVLWSRSRGNPGLLAEILRGLIERGQAHPRLRGEPGLVLAIPPERLPLPGSLQTVIAERYRELSATDRRWLQRLAVTGGRIDPAFLQRAFPTASARAIDGVLSRLVRAGWLVAAGDRYRFARPALREAVYRSLDPDVRRRLHAAAARALAGGGPGAPIPLGDAFQRAFHLRAAGEHGALNRILPPLITALLRRGQPQRVHALSRWGLEALDALPSTRGRDRQRVAYLEAAADAADRLGVRAEQRQWLDRLSDLDLSPERDDQILARVYLLHGRYAVSTGNYGLARSMLRNAVELSERSGGPPELHSEALRRLAAVQAHVGELALARSLARRALEAAAHGPQEAVAWLQIATVDLLENDLEEALRGVDRALSLLRRASGWNLPGAFAAAHMLRGRIWRLAGRPRRALGSMGRAVKLARQAGERRLEVEAAARLGGLLLDLDRPAEAEARLRDALLLAREIEDRRGEALAGLWLGILLFESRDPEAERLLERAARLSGGIGLNRAEALALAVQARAARQAGRPGEALERSGRASLLLERHGAELADRIVITGTRALVLHGAGQTDEAAGMIVDLRRRLRRENRRIENPAMRQRHRQASTRLLEAVLIRPDVIYPRVELEGDAALPAALPGPA